MKDAYREWQKAVSKILLVHRDQAFVEKLLQMDRLVDAFLSHVG
jgi:hypothetical protein